MKAFAKFADILFYVSLIGLVLAAYGAFSGTDLWLAPTQWVEVSMAVVIYALYLKHTD
jgi:hypothetical protein